MGLNNEIRGLNSDRYVHCLCVCGHPRQAPCVCGHFSHLKQVDFDVRGSLLIAVMIHVIQIASTRDYHSEVDTLVTKQNTSATTLISV
jgi:hypothetical protein